MEKKEKQPENVMERRALCVPVTLEKRDDGESRKISGYAAVFEQKTKIGSYYEEMIARGAFDDCDFSRCVLNFNHDDSNLLARTSSGTLKLTVDERGLRFEADLPNTTLANDLLELIRRGDIDGCSFRFVVREASWEWLSDADPAQLDQRKILKIAEVLDVSPVTHPAYSQTSVDLRSAKAAAEQVREEERKEKEKEAAAIETARRNREVQFLKINSHA